MIIFGSSVTDFCDENSDLDICLDITGSSKNLEMFNSVADMSGVCGGECDILIYNHIAGPLKKTIDRKGVVVYELPQNTDKRGADFMNERCNCLTVK